MHSTQHTPCLLHAGLVLAAFALLAACHAGSADNVREADSISVEFQRDFGIEQRKFKNVGMNPYFVLLPGHSLELADGEDRLTITVLDETRQVGNVSTRVVEEREEEDGKLVEVSRNFFAIDVQSNDVFYFGEEVDVYKNGKISSHPGAWLAGENGAQAGVLIPGTPRLGAKYYQEIAPGVAMDRAEIVELAATLKTPAGEFKNCLRTHESTGLDKKESEYKLYAPGIGLLKDEDLLLVRYARVQHLGY